MYLCWQICAQILQYNCSFVCLNELKYNYLDSIYHVTTSGGIMKRFFQLILTVICLASIIGTLVACGSGETELLASAKVVDSLQYSERQSQDVQNIISSANSFAAQFSEHAYHDLDTQGNFTVAPISVYMALSMAAQCAAGDTRNEIASALGLSYEQLSQSFSSLYRSLFAEYKSHANEIAGRLQLTNSIWVDNRATVNNNCIDILANDFMCHAYSANFSGDNANANKQLSKFIKKQTNNLIDQDFNLSPSTLFAIVNTLYLKDIWNDSGVDLPYSPGQYSFIQKDGSVDSVRLLQGYYKLGKVYESQMFTHFLTVTEHGYKIKFIVPKDGYTVEDVFTAETIGEINAISDYQGTDHENKIEYLTRCIFPEFKAEFNENVKSILQQHFGVSRLFSAMCDFSTLTSNSVYCDRVQHVAKLAVDKTGVEGAAVTVMNFPESAAPGERYEQVLYDFVVDRAFGFVLTDVYDTVIFTGVVAK